MLKLVIFLPPNNIFLNYCFTYITAFLLMFAVAFPLTIKAQPCYELNKGNGLSLFSPFLNANPRGKATVKGGSFGDQYAGRMCNGAKKRWVISLFNFSKAEPVFAVHSGVATIYTTASFVENNQANDGLWINGDSITSTYMGIIPSVTTGQYVYAGQQIGNILIDAQIENSFGIGIRRAPALNPFHKRGFLPVIADSTGSCKCMNDPLWPEYFVDPVSVFLDYSRMNEKMPEASLRISMQPGGIGKWSFDNGVTWFNSGDKVEGLPYGFYRIIFKNEYGYRPPAAYTTAIYATNKDLVLDVKYSPDYNILTKPGAELQRQKDIEHLNLMFTGKFDSLSHIANENAHQNSLSLRGSIIDSLNERFIKIETIQQETFFFTKLFKYLLPVLLIVTSFVIILFFQNNRIRKQKKYLEVLQKEQHHRVHNNLGIVSSLLSKYKDDIDSEKLLQVNNSVIAISTVHRQLYRGNTFGELDFQPVIEQIADSILIQNELKNLIQTDLNARVIIAQNKSTTLALIFNELFVNSIKYAFDNREEKRISFSVVLKNGNFTVLYKDSGKGYSNPILKNNTTGFGLKLLEGLAHQLKAKIFFYNENGACCLLKFEK